MNVFPTRLTLGIFRIASLLLASLSLGTADTLRDQFQHPPAEARPWVYWTWLSSNLTREGITADLEAMQRVGIGGALILDVDQGTPPGTMKFFDSEWQAMFKHMVSEAKRLGLEINMNNGPGYYGSGGARVPPELGMQSVVSSEVSVKGGESLTLMLAKPVDRPDYRDIAVLAIAEPKRAAKERYQIPGFKMKALQWRGWVGYTGAQSAPLDAIAPAEAIVPRDRVLDLTGKMDGSGKLTWHAPAGEWTVLRFGHAYNGSEIGPTPKDQRGPETDKLSKAATVHHFDTFVKRLNAVAGDAKAALVATHIDSWEGGGQTWTPGMREEFKKRRGYDPVPYLAVLAGRVVGDLQVTERFLWDLRKTVSELVVQNYAAEFQRLAHENGLRLTFESYTTVGNDLDVANWVDEPMAEFWTPTGQGQDFYPTTKSMASAAHLNGRRVVGAEAFTSFRTERWLWHPAMIKKLGDETFAQGVNRFVFHRYASQPFLNRVPGLQMGPWGLHYERTNTWWEWSTPWHAYLTRCQYLLRQGEPVADVLSLQSEEPILRFQQSPLSGYDYDACSSNTFENVRVQNGLLVLPSGRAYRLLTLKHTGTMSIPLLTRIRDLVQQGAVVLGNLPAATPGLTDYPQADATLRQLAEEIWGKDPAVPMRQLGKGKVFRGVSPEHVLARLGIPPDFSSDKKLRWIHRQVGETEVYFVANTSDERVTATCTFRVHGKVPEYWDGETGQVTPIDAYDAGSNESTRLTLPFEPSGSAFIVFRAGSSVPKKPIQTIARDGIALVEHGIGSGEDNAVDPLRGEVSQAGHYVVTRTDGAASAFDVPPLPEPVDVLGPWTLRFPPGWGAPPEVRLEELVSWNYHADPGVRFFSGTALYSKTLNVPASSLRADRRVYLDLGTVCVMARVKLNGRDLGILWKPPYRVDITAAVKPGANELEISVVNLWANRLIGDEHLPEDSERNPNGTLKSWPQWLLEGKPSPTGRFTFSSWRLWGKNDLLQDSGLLGPVTLRTVAVMPP